jgi:hypothetical protein
MIEAVLFGIKPIAMLIIIFWGGYFIGGNG